MLQSMTDAKFAVSHLFSVATEKIKENLNKSTLISELMVIEILFKILNENR